MKCQHESCLCTEENFEKAGDVFCSEHCRILGSPNAAHGSSEERCGCRHTGCWDLTGQTGGDQPGTSGD